MILTLPISGFVSVISLTILRLSCGGIQAIPGLPSGLVDLSLIPVAVPGRCGVRRSGLASCRPLPLAPLPKSATGGGRVAPLLGKLLVGDKFLHTDFLLIWFLKSVYHNRAKMHKRFVNPETEEDSTIRCHGLWRCSTLKIFIICVKEYLRLKMPTEEASVSDQIRIQHALDCGMNKL